jgi:hypothetical protein
MMALRRKVRDGARCAICASSVSGRASTDDAFIAPSWAQALCGRVGGRGKG